ncbi:MAG TPA: hypothetical protein VFV71_03220 [Burkholderiales bacterium]|nr:hypothetical protein [Burkholderiales bacterium]
MKPKIRTAARGRRADARPAASAAPAAVSRRDLRVARRIAQAFGVLPATPGRPA